MYIHYHTHKIISQCLDCDHRQGNPLSRNIGLTAKQTGMVCTEIKEYSISHLYELLCVIENYIYLLLRD